MIRSTPTRATCTTCGTLMAAVRGPFSQNIRRPDPPAGYRLGYIQEVKDRELPICVDCVNLTLTVKEN